MKKCQTQKPKKPTLESLGFLTVDGIAVQEDNMAQSNLGSNPGSDSPLLCTHRKIT